jgi:geranylgeranyl diphosphate synthase, type II
MEKTTVLEFLQKNNEDVDQAILDSEVSRQPFSLYEPVVHVLSSRGKRLRPQLVLCAASIFNGDREAALQVALAMEIFHIFTLVHDDIMDHADSRRGHTTIHVKWDEPTAILSGDYLLGRATELLLSLPDKNLRTGLGRFSQTVRELCEGQIRDMEFEARQDVTLDEYLSMIDQKTSALLKTSLVLGGLTGNVTVEEVEKLDLIGYHLGRAFQIQDDFLDLTAESHDWGKPVGGDFIAGKKAFLLLEAIRVEQEQGGTFFQTIATHGGVTSSQVPEIRERLDQLGVLESAQKTVRFHSGTAAALTQDLKESLGKQGLLALIKKMSVRTH